MPWLIFCAENSAVFLIRYQCEERQCDYFLGCLKIISLDKFKSHE